MRLDSKVTKTIDGTGALFIDKLLDMGTPRTGQASGTLSRFVRRTLKTDPVMGLKGKLGIGRHIFMKVFYSRQKA